jgi:queuine tRNA-ribosyltransferase
MPVGTQGSVRALSPRDLEAIGARIVLANTYHLFLRPGEETVAKLGGLHRFMGWPHPILTDSGGFQVFSLESLRRVTEEGVEFRSHIDGSARFLSPERAVEVQWALGSDIAMAFDHVIPGQASREAARDALDRTLRWLVRCKARFGALGRADIRHQASDVGGSTPDVRRLTSDVPRQTLVPIIQGGTWPDLRRESAERTLAAGDWDAVAVGGLSVGEPKAATFETLESLGPILPTGRPRYLMGVGFPEDVVGAIARGVDLADCVAPTRMGRNGAAFTDDGPVNIRNARHRDDAGPGHAVGRCFQVDLVLAAVLPLGRQVGEVDRSVVVGAREDIGGGVPVLGPGMDGEVTLLDDDDAGHPVRRKVVECRLDDHGAGNLGDGERTEDAADGPVLRRVEPASGRRPYAGTARRLAASWLPGAASAGTVLDMKVIGLAGPAGSGGNWEGSARGGDPWSSGTARDRLSAAEYASRPNESAHR